MRNIPLRSEVVTAMEVVLVQRMGILEVEVPVSKAAVSTDWGVLPGTGVIRNPIGQADKEPGVVVVLAAVVEEEITTVEVEVVVDTLAEAVGMEGMVEEEGQVMSIRRPLLWLLVVRGWATG